MISQCTQCLHIRKKLEAQVDQKSLALIMLIMICNIVPWWPSWPSDQVAFSNFESDVVWRVSRWPPWSMSLWRLPSVRLNPTYGLGDVVWRISRWPPWQPSWILERNDFNNAKSPCRSDCLPSYFGSNQLRRRCRSYNFKLAGGQLGYQNGTFLAILNVHVSPTIPTRFKLNPTYHSGGDVVWRFSRTKHMHISIPCSRHLQSYKKTCVKL